jgi:hypothetical protein
MALRTGGAADANKISWKPLPHLAKPRHTGCLHLVSEGGEQLQEAEVSRSFNTWQRLRRIGVP